MAGALHAIDEPSSRIETRLEGLTLIYHRPSGQTHILAEPAPEILALLAKGSKTRDALFAALGQAYDIGDDIRGFDARLDELVETGLVLRS